MKTLPYLAALLSAGLCTSCGPGMLTKQRTVWAVDCDLQVVSMPQELALPLVEKLRDPHRVEGAYQEVQKLLAEKRATLVGWPRIVTPSGQRAVFEQIEEVRYATEYRVPATTTGSAALGVDQSAKVEPKVDPTTAEPMPTEFETRNAGVTFEVEPIITGDGEMIEINMVPQSVRLLGWNKSTIEKDPPGVKFTVEQPRFFTTKLTTQMNFRNGERKLLGLFKVPEPPGSLEFYILRVAAMKRKVTVATPVPPTRGAPPPSAGPPNPSPPQ